MISADEYTAFLHFHPCGLYARKAPTIIRMVPYLIYSYKSNFSFLEVDILLSKLLIFFFKHSTK